MDPFTSPCILVVEDHVLLRASIGEALSEIGYYLIEAQDGAEALHLASAYNGLIQVLVTAVRMPGLDGHQLVRQLKPERPDLRVLLLSAEPEKVFPIEAQYDAYLQKPVSPRVVALTVGKLLREPRKPGTLPPYSVRVQAILTARQDNRMTLEQLETELKILSTKELQQIVQAIIDRKKRL